MGIAIELNKREEVVLLHESGYSMRAICHELGISYPSVRRLIKGYKKEGSSSIELGYHRCGRVRTYESESTYRLVRLYKHYHPDWGVAYILLKLREKYSGLVLSSSRTYERRLRTEQIRYLVKNPPLQYDYKHEDSRLAHDCWQIDAKEQLKTLDGQAACYLTVTDEKTGCLLEAKVFSLWLYQSSTPRASTSMFVGDVQKMGTSQGY